MDLRIQGQSIIRVSLDTSLVLLTSEECELRVGTEATLAMSDGARCSFVPESPGAVVTHLAKLQDETVEAANVGNHGNLAIAFESGATLAVPAHDDYEAWEFVGPHGRRVVCMPGGEIATWESVTD